MPHIVEPIKEGWRLNIGVSYSCTNILKPPPRHVLPQPEGCTLKHIDGLLQPPHFVVLDPLKTCYKEVTAQPDIDILEDNIWPFNIFFRHRDEDLPNKILREAHTEKIKLWHFCNRTPTVVFTSLLCITDVRIPSPWTSGGSLPLPMHPRYLISVFARGKFFREAVLIINLDDLPSDINNIFLVCSLANIISCVLIWSSCFVVFARFRSARMSACGCNQYYRIS